MARKNWRLLTILGAAVGTGLAAYGIREGVRWYRRQMNERFDMRLPESVWHADQPMREVVPITGTQVASSTAGMSTAERVNSDRLADFDERGTAFSAAESSRVDLDDTPAAIVMDEYVAPLIEHAIAFNSVINLLRSRQREGAGFEGTESLTAGDRNSMRAVLDQMQEHVVDRDEASLRRHPLALRSYRLTRKLREALDNLDYTGTDLFRIHSDVSKELCSLTQDLDRSGQVTITGLRQIRYLYGC